MSANDDKRIKSIDSKEIYAHGTSTDPVCKKEKIKRKDIIKQFKNDNDVTKENIKVHNPNLFKFQVIQIGY